MTHSPVAANTRATYNLLYLIPEDDGAYGGRVKKVAVGMAAVAEIIRLSESQIQQALAEFERRFGMSSREFLSRWKSGEFEDADREEYLDWASLCYMARLSVAPTIPV